LPRYDVKFEPDNVHVNVEHGVTVLEAAKAGGVPLFAPCGGKGICGKCRCRAMRGSVEVTEQQARSLAAAELEAGWRLACQSLVVGDLTVMLPPEVRAAGTVILEDSELAAPGWRPAPQTRKPALSLRKPSLRDQRDDLRRVVEALAESGLEPSAVDFPAVLPHLASACRAEDWHVTAVVRGGVLVGVEAGDTTDACYGVAVDLGTTTVVAYLAHIPSGTRVAVASDVNPQVAYGDDVVSRISYVTTEVDGLATLTAAARSIVSLLVDRLCEAADIPASRIYDMRIVGNATMTHIILGADPRSIAPAPYIPSVQRSVEMPARELGLDGLAPGARVRTLPNIAGWVGSDTVGVILATRMHTMEGVRIAIDIGTNGEIVAGGAGRLVACSTAAGPAFEGAQIRFGMRGADGAIDHVRLRDGNIETTAIGGSAPRGICGTGLIDAVACLVATGVLSETGRMRGPGAVDDLEPAIGDRVIEMDGQPAFVLAAEEETALDGPVVLTQRDVRQLQLAKGAISAGVRIAMKTIGAEMDDVLEVLLAGAFGSYVDPASAAAIGLFPGELAGKARAVGNAAGAGAFAALVSEPLSSEADLIGVAVEYLELAGRPDFDMIFADAMMLAGAES